jgi:DNA-nicking Smr family endonuclease
MASRPDADDWQEGVEPLPGPRRVVHARPRPAPLPRETWRDVVEASLDLHGLNRSEAAAALREFLHRSRARRLGCVRIVHGTGLGSRNREPVLKGNVYQGLKLRDEVLAFAQAPAVHGGSGALLVLLRS